MSQKPVDEATSRPLVMVVEDNPAMNAAICDILAYSDFEVSSASNGQVALTMIRERRPHLILCDIMMPVMDGYALLQHTRSDPELRTLPFIFLTARTSTEDRRLAKRIGIEDYLTKPFDPDDLILAVNNALRRAASIAAENRRQMDEMRNQIVGVLQHEFRTPLTLVLGYAEYLLDTSSDNINMADLLTAASAILDGGRRLQKLIESFLLLAELQHRASLSDDMELLNSVDVLSAAAREMQPQVAAAALALEVVKPHGVLRMLGSERHLRDAIKRLIDNAVQYRRAESRTIQLSVLQELGYVGLSVQDEGIGISPQMLKELMQPFYQIDRRNRQQAGTGLSLSLVQHIARLHGGEVTIASQEEQGSRFTLWLPSLETPGSEGALSPG